MQTQEISLEFNMERFNRTIQLLKQENFDKFSNSNVIVFGLGGVGGYVVEGLIRSGLKKIAIVDNDLVHKTNINRQIIADETTIGMKKTQAIKNRILKINSNVEVEEFDLFFDVSSQNEINFEKYDYIVDAIDCVSSKILLAQIAQDNNIKIISSMGTGNKLDPTMFEISDIYKTSVCPLARVMRTELKKRKINKLKVVYSKEVPIKSNLFEENKNVPLSCAFVPSVAGFVIASEVVKDLISV